MKTKPVLVRLTEEQHKKLKHYSADIPFDVSAIIRDAIDQYFNTIENDKGFIPMNKRSKI